MDLAPPTLDPPQDTPPHPVTSPAPAGGRVLGGVAALLSARLGVDALWIRLAFVVTTLVSGVGAVVYAACWLGLVVGPQRHGARIAGGALLVGGVPLALAVTSGPFLRGPVAIVVLLVGLALALWQPRRTAPVVAPSAAVAGVGVTLDGSVPVDITPPVAAVEVARERSVLGRLTLGVAAVVAALGALVDQANGGRMHPEQWLGAAAVVCGIGLVVGAFAGRARWLVFPAVLFAGAGFVGGQVARVGLDDPTLAGDQWINIGEYTPAGMQFVEHVVAGSVSVQVDSAPPGPVAVDARTGFGDVHVQVVDGVSVDVRGRGGDVVVDGVARPAGTYRIGPDGPADVVVAARVGSGRVVVDHYEPYVYVPEITAPPEVAVGPSGPEVSPGVVVDGGTVVLAGGEAVLDSDGTVLVGPSYVDGETTVIETSVGPFRVLPGAKLLTPWGDVVDLTEELAAAPGAELSPPVTTVPGG